MFHQHRPLDALTIADVRKVFVTAGYDNRYADAESAPLETLELSFKSQTDQILVFGRFDISNSRVETSILKKKARTSEALFGQIDIDLSPAEGKCTIEISVAVSTSAPNALKLVEAGIKKIEAAHADFLGFLRMYSDRGETFNKTPSATLKKRMKVRPELSEGQALCSHCQSTAVPKRQYNPQPMCSECAKEVGPPKVGGSKAGRAAARIERSGPRWR